MFSSELKIVGIVVCCREVQQRKIECIFGHLYKVINANDGKSKLMQREFLMMVQLIE